MNKWDVIRVYRRDIIPPHDKFCLCLCPIRKWFFYFNSNPPPFRKAREVAVEVENFEALFLTHTSYVDVSTLITDVPDDALTAALADQGRLHGQIAPFLIARVCAAVRIAASLSDAAKDHISI